MPCKLETIVLDGYNINLKQSLRADQDFSSRVLIHTRFIWKDGN